MRELSEPLVTVVIPSYNHQDYVEFSIRSIVEQDYRNIELIVIDDGSSDGSVSRIRQLEEICKKRFVRFEFRSRPNKGLCATLNEALEWAAGDFFSPFASDDIALPHKISFLVGKLLAQPAPAAFGRFVGVGDAVKARRRRWNVRHSFKSLFLQGRMPAAPTALIRTSCIRDVGGYAEDLKLEDWYLWLKLTEGGAVLTTYQETVALYRGHASNMSSDQGMMAQARREVVDKFRHHPLYPSALRSLDFASARAYRKTDKTKARGYLKKYGYLRPRAWTTLLKTLF